VGCGATPRAATGVAESVAPGGHEPAASAASSNDQWIAGNDQ
jgi:hypothetical protein